MGFLARAREPGLFGLIGIFGTALHGAVVILLVESGAAAPVAANVAAFLCANAFSYMANSRLNFRCPPSLGRYLGFLGVSLGGLALTVGFAALAEGLRWHYLAGLALVVGVTPVITYSLLRAWVFRRAGRPAAARVPSPAGGS